MSRIADISKGCHMTANKGLERFDRNSAASPALAPARTLSRQGAVQIAAFFPEDVRTQLKIVAAEQRRNVQDLLAEGLNLIFAKYGKPQFSRPRRRGARPPPVKSKSQDLAVADFEAPNSS
jgi:hypothetical protein